MSDNIKSLILLGILFTSALGGIIGGWIADKIGQHKTLAIILMGWLIIFPSLAFARDFRVIVTITVIMGLWFGAVWMVSRSVMSYLAPENKTNHTFAYFGLAERVSSFIGPLVWGGIATGLVTLGPDRYRLALLVITIFIGLGLSALFKVPSDKEV